MKNKATILIVVPRYNLGNNINYNYLFPLGLGFISAILKRAGYQVDCLNLNHKEGKLRDVINKSLSAKKYDYVGTGSNSLRYSVIERIIETVHEHGSKPKIILGGPIITSEPELVFNALKPDYAVIGEGEETIIELIECSEQNGKFEDVKGIGYWDKDGKARFTESREAITDLDSLPAPNFEGIGFGEQIDHLHPNYDFSFNVADYPRPYPLLASRGCPYKCTFCYHFERYRARSIDSIMEELIIMVKRYRINIITIFDECFATKNTKDRVYEFCARIKKFREELSWDLKWTCQMSVNAIDKDMLQTMKDAGCDIINYGFESYSPEVLRSMRKPITPEQLDFALKATFDVKMGVQANFIFGDVAETIETAGETLNYWKDNCKGQVSLAFIQPYPGSNIYDHCLRKGLITDKLYFIKNELPYYKTRNMTDKMTDEEFNWLQNEVNYSMGKYREIVRPLSVKKIKQHSYSVEVKCPYCKASNIYDNCFIDNKLTYYFNMHCRNCLKRFVVVSFIMNIVYSNYSSAINFKFRIRKIRDFFKKLRL